MNCLVIGYGSIGARHARLLSELGCRTTVVSRRPQETPDVYPDLHSALIAENPGYVVIANRTIEHQQTLADLHSLNYQGTVLVEKPLFHQDAEAATERFRQVFVAYNLRFHPLLQRLRDCLAGERIISVQAYVGQYLPLWRPERDYRTVYSASKSEGGGVLRDLSHELDLLHWLLGDWQALTALGGRFSALEISSEDTFSILMKTGCCPIAELQMNYLDRAGRRRILVNTEEHTFEADLFAGTLMIDKNIETFTVERDDSYRGMHRAVLEDRTRDICTFTEGRAVLRMISAAEQAAMEGRWVTP